MLTLGLITSSLAWLNATWWVPQTASLKTQILKDVQDNINTEHFKAGQFTSFNHGNMMAYITHSDDEGSLKIYF